MRPGEEGEIHRERREKCDRVFVSGVSKATMPRFLLESWESYYAMAEEKGSPNEKEAKGGKVRSVTRRRNDV